VNHKNGHEIVIILQLATIFKMNLQKSLILNYAIRHNFTLLGIEE